MAESTFVQLRIDNNLKQDAIDVLDEIGIDMPTAIRMFLKRVVLERRIPFDTQLPARGQDINGEAVQHKNMRLEYIPASPATMVAEFEYFEALCKVPVGKVTRMEDVLAYLKKKHKANRVEILHDKPLSYEEITEIPLWREVSVRGFLQDSSLCSRDRQEKMLKEEGLPVVPCGAYRKSLKVEDYQKYLFDFNTIDDIKNSAEE